MLNPKRNDRTLAKQVLILYALGAALSACSSSSKSNATSGSGGSLSSGGASATGGTEANGGAAGGTTVAACPAPPDLGVRFVGRVDGCDSTGVRIEWSGTGFIGKFAGTGFSVELNDHQNQYTVLIDGALMPTLKTIAGQQTYTLAAGLDEGEHIVEFYRRTEASQGVTVVLNVEAERGDAGMGELLEPPVAHSRRIEIIGDSITCGYGNEGTSPCAFTPDTENNYSAYGSILARDLQAELSTVAWSGKGVYSNYGGNRVQPMPDLYDLSVPTDTKHPWDFNWKPDLVIINLGTNDYSTSSDPTVEQFTTAYQTFLEHVRGKYPDAFILCTIGPLLADLDLAAVRTNVGTAIAARAAAGDTKVKYYELTTPNASPPGCDYHPNLATHQAMAAELTSEIRADLGWQ